MSIHIFPDGDQRGHKTGEDDDCPCGVTLEPNKRRRGEAVTYRRIHQPFWWPATSTALGAGLQKEEGR